MQQDMGISLAPPHLGAPIPMFEYRSLQKNPLSKKLAIISPEAQLSSVSVPTRVFRTAGRHMYRIIAVSVAVINDLIPLNQDLLLSLLLQLLF